MPKVVQWSIAGVVVLFLLGPQLAILPLAFNADSLLNFPMAGLSFRWFQELLSSPSWRLGIGNSVVIGFASAGLATLFGTLAALGLRNREERVFSFLRVFFILPMIVPVVLLGVGMQIVFAPAGLANGYSGVIIGHTVVAIPFVVANVSAALSGINPLIEQAATSLGASPPKTFLFVTLPLALPGIITGGVFALATSFDEVVLTLFLAGPNQRTVAREIFGQLQYSLTPAIVAVAFVFIVATICAGALSLILKRRDPKLGPTLTA